MWVQVAGGCDLTESSVLGGHNKQFTNEDQVKNHEESPRHPAVKAAVNNMYVLWPLDRQNLTRPTFNAKVGVSEELWYLLWWMFLFSQRSLWCIARNAAENQVDHPKKATGSGQSQRFLKFSSGHVHTMWPKCVNKWLMCLINVKVVCVVAACGSYGALGWRSSRCWGMFLPLIISSKLC